MGGKECADFKPAYDLYQEFLDILHLPQSDYKEALNSWIDKCIDGECKTFSASAKNFRKNWFLAILRSLTYTAYYRRNGITYKTSFNNGFCESQNNKVKLVKRNAFGYKNVSAKLYSVPKKDDKIIFDLIVLYSKLFFNLITPWHEPVNLLWMLNDINLRHYLQYILYVVKGIKPISFSCLNQAVY